MSLFKELKRRNVFKVAIAYAITTWILLQLAEAFGDYLALPEWAPELILLVLVVGFVPALILAWAFELTPSGIRLQKHVPANESITRKTGRKLDYAIIVSLGLSLGYFIWESRFEQKTAAVESAKSDTATQEVPVEDSLQPIIVLDPNIDKNSIAVLPFANRSTDAEDIYFTDGIHDDLLTQLSRIDAFSVISRTSVMEYRGTTKNLRQIAYELSVANVLEGSVQRAGDRVRINVQLIDAYTDEHLWAEIYDRELTTGNLFDIQSEIAIAVAEALKTTLTEIELANVGNTPTEIVAAYDLHLQARRFARKETKRGYQTAIELLKESLALDPGFELAWIGLARAHITNYWFYGGDPANRALAREAIDRARNIKAEFPELYMAEGFYWYWGHLDYERALYNLERAIAMMPGNDEAYMWHGWASRRAGQWEQARQSIQEALKLNPRVIMSWQEFALTDLWLHRYEDARASARQALALDPDNYRGRTALSRIVLQESGDLQTATQMTDGAQNTDDRDAFEAFMDASILARNFEEALKAARNISGEMEIQRNLIDLREARAAQILHYMGHSDDARQAAAAALFRLKGLRNELGDDFRIDLAEAMVRTIQGAGADEVRELVQTSMSSQPADEVEKFRFKLEHARIFGIAGLAPEAIEILEGILVPPSATSVYTIELDPAFDAIRNDPEFIAMTERADNNLESDP